MASELDPALVEDVAKATWKLKHRDTPWDSVRGITRALLLREAAVAIRAVNAYRAASVRAAVDTLMTASSNAEATHLMSSARIEADARAALLALVGAEETE